MTTDPRLTPADGDLRDRTDEPIPCPVDHQCEEGEPCGCWCDLHDVPIAECPTFQLVASWLKGRDTELERLQRALDGAGQHIGQVIKRAEDAEQEAERLRAELAEAKAKLPKCNGMCLKASDVLDDLSRVVGDPVARAHRSCPLHGDPDAVAWELDAALKEAEAERDAAHAAIRQAREELRKLHVFGAVRRGEIEHTDTVIGEVLTILDAALDAPTTEETHNG